MRKRTATVVSSSCHSSIEILECRIAPAGLVTANLVGGVLTLTGDVADNDLTLHSVGPNTVILDGNNGTMIALNGAAPAASVSLSAFLSKVMVGLAGGNDTLNLNLLQIGGLSFDGGEGNNTLQLTSSDVAGALSVQGGSGNDVFTTNGVFFHVGGALTLNLGDGVNDVSITANGGMEIGGATLITGGSGKDTISLFSTSGLVAKGITAKLGAGDNVFSLAAQDVQTGPIAVTHLDHAGTANTLINSSGSIAVKGGLSVTYGTGSSVTNITAGSQMTVGGPLKVTSTGGADMVILGGTGPVTLGATTLALGNGANTVNVNALEAILPSLTLMGGADADTFNFSSASARIGALTLNLGDGTNGVTLNIQEGIVGGLVKMTSGVGDDTFILGGASVRLGKGLTYQAGDGVNNLSIGCNSFQSGPIQVNYGNHAMGTSTVSVASGIINVSGPTTITTADGNEAVTFSGSTVAMGPVTAKLGEGDNALTFSAASVRLGALAVTTGPGMDVVTASGQEIILSALKAQLGAGNNSISSMGNNLTVGGVISVTTGAGDDSVAFSNVVQKTKGATLSLGDGLSQVSFAGSTVQMRGALTLQAGSHAAGTSSLLLNGVAALAVGAVNATFGNGDNTATISSNGPSKVASAKMIGGTGNDAMLISGTSRFFIGGSTFQGGNGTNNLSVLVTSGSVGAVKYTGGDEVDALVVQAALSPAGGVTAQMGAGNYIVNLIGGVQAKFAGPVNVSAQNTAAQVGNVFLTGATFAGVTINTGDGADTIQASDVIFGGSFSANTAGGNDLVNIETFTTGIPSVFRGPVTVLLGDGDDTLAVGVNTPTGHAEFKSKVKFDGGTGADTAHISAALFANIYLPGQPIALNFETKD